MGQLQSRRSAVANPVFSVAPSPRAELESPPRPASAPSLADLERRSGLGHRFGEIATRSPHAAAIEPAGAPSPGHPLPTGVRGHFERAFGADFSDVRVHHESTLPPSPLRAFTRGSHLHFAPTRFKPGTPEGDALIGHELAHVTQQRERRVAPDGGAHGGFNTQPHLEQEARQMGDRAARGEIAPVGSSAARPQAASGPAPVQAGLFDLMGAANPRLYAPTWLGGHSEEHLEERQWQGRTGPLDALGPANPRLYLPTALGGYSEGHLAERRQQRRSGPFDLLGPLNPRLRLPTALGGHSTQHLQERAVQGRSGPLDLLGPANPRQYLPTRLGGHSYDELSRRQRNGTDEHLTALPRSLVGQGVKRLGKATRIQWVTRAGQQMHHGHLSPEQLLKQHPSAFLRTHPIESAVQNGGHSDDNVRSQTAHRFFLSRYGALGNNPAGYTLRQADDLRNEHVDDPRGPVFRAGFLPMRQMANDADAANTVAAGGGVWDADLDRAHENVTLTTQLSGCSITHQGGQLQHLRPQHCGATLNTSLEAASPGSTYGRNDYPHTRVASPTSFVMTKKEANGRTRLYHQLDNNPALSGKRYLT